MAAGPYDPQAIANALVNLDEETAVNVITTVLVSRPELAPPVVNFAVPDLTYPPSKALVERRAKGLVKSINNEKGFGFIECKELHEVFGNDVFVHSKQMTGLAPGQQVNFAIVLNKENKPQAFDICLDSGKPTMPFVAGAPAQAPQDAQLAMQMQLMQGTALMPGMPAMDPGVPKRRKNNGVPDVKEELGRCRGQLKSFNEQTGYGFIQTKEFGDVFLHHHQAVGHTVGATVDFTVYKNSQDKLQAKDLVAVADDPSLMQPDPNAMMQQFAAPGMPPGMAPPSMDAGGRKRLFK